MIFPKAENKISLLGFANLAKWNSTSSGLLGLQNLLSLLLGLTFYTGAFIAEIVREEFNQSRGQLEAAKSLGLKTVLAIQFVIFPQALRVIIPPLTSQYLNLTKISSSAMAIGYPDIYFVASTTFNRTRKAESNAVNYDYLSDFEFDNFFQHEFI